MQKAMYHIKTKQQEQISILTYCRQNNYSYNVIYKLIKNYLNDSYIIDEEILKNLIIESNYEKNVHRYNIKLTNGALIGISVYTNGNKNKAYRRLYRYMSDHHLTTITIEEAEQIINNQTKHYTNQGLWIITKEGIRTPLSGYFHITSGVNYISLRDYMRVNKMDHINELFIIKDKSYQSVFLLGLNLEELAQICDYMIKYQTTEIDYYFLTVELSKQKSKKRVLTPIK